MNCHLVYCHPSERSFAMEIRERVLDGLRNGSSDWHLTEALLYEHHFDPVLSARDYEQYADQSSMDELAAQYGRQLRAADHAIWIFPVWMYSLPAMLKGYLDKVWRPGVTFQLTGGGVEPLLTRLQSVIVCCTFGQSIELVQARGDPVQNLFERMIDQNCLAHCRVAYYPCYGCDDISPERRVAYLNGIAGCLPVAAANAGQRR